jgi:ankyrin repeat protein
VLRNENAPASADAGMSMKAEQAQAGAPSRAAAATAAAPSRTPAARARLTDADGTLHRLAAAGSWPAFAGRLAAGAPVDGRDAQGRTPLMVAAEAGQTDMVRQLLRADADTRLVDDAGRTALHWAQRAGRDEVVRLLVEADSRVDGAGR